MAPDETVVTYSVRELFERIDERLSAIDHKLSTKAEQSTVDSLSERVDRLEGARDRLLGIALGLGVTAGGISGAIVRAILG